LPVGLVVVGQEPRLVLPVQVLEPLMVQVLALLLLLLLPTKLVLELVPLSTRMSTQRHYEA
jgi:hypothetical protein